MEIYLISTLEEDDIVNNLTDISNKIWTNRQGYAGTNTKTARS